MKTDLATSILAAVFGVVIAYFVTNLFLGSAEDFTFKVVNTKVEASLAEPNPEVFNYRALNPTVEIIIEGSSSENNTESNPGQQEDQ